MRTMSLWPCIWLAVSWCAVGGVALCPHCPTGYFYDSDRDKCQQCSTCPKAPCSECKNLQCESPSFQFEPPFSPSIKTPGSLSQSLFPVGSQEGDHDSYPDAAASHPDPPNYGISIAKPLSPRTNGGKGESRGKSDKHHLVDSEDVDGNADKDAKLDELALERNDWQYWKTLAFALIALLSALIIIATVVVVVACLKLQQALIIKQQEEAEIDDADSGYVVIRTIRGVNGLHSTYSDHNIYRPEDRSAHPLLLASQDTGLGESSGGPPSTSSPPQSMCFLPRVYKPQRRLLAYDADDVFESDDQSRVTITVSHSQSAPGVTNSGMRLQGSSHSIPAMLTDEGPSISCQKHRKWLKKKTKTCNFAEEEPDASVGCFGKRKHGGDSQVDNV